MADVAKHLILPEDAFDDLKALLSLGQEQLRSLVSLFGSAYSVTTTRLEMAEQVAERLQVDYESAKNIVFLSSFLLSVVGDGAPPDEVLKDVEAYVVKRGTPAAQHLLGLAVDHRDLFLSLLTPTAERVASRRRFSTSKRCGHGPHHSERFVSSARFLSLAARRKR